MKVIYDPNYKSLSKIYGKKKYHLTGVYSKLKYHNKPVIVFKYLAVKGDVVARNIAMNYSYHFTKLGQLKPGDKLAFNAQLRKRSHYLRTPSGSPVAQYISLNFGTPHHVKLLSGGFRPSLAYSRLTREGYTMIKTGVISKKVVAEDPDFLNEYLKAMNPRTTPTVTREEANDMLRTFSVKGITLSLICLKDIVNHHYQKMKRDSPELRTFINYMAYINGLPPYSDDNHRFDHSPMNYDTIDTLTTDADFYRMNFDDYDIEVRNISHQDFVDAYNEILDIFVYIGNTEPVEK